MRKNSIRRSKFSQATEASNNVEASWLATFADMVTLLLTFLVLIISVTNVELRTPFTKSEGVLEEDDNQHIRLGNGVLLFSDRTMLEPLVKMVEELVKLPKNMYFDQDSIKEALFQLEPTHTPDFEKLQETVDEGVEIFKDHRGLVIQWDRNLLFPEGSAFIYEENMLLLQKMAILLLSLDLPVSVESHTNPLSPLEGVLGPESYSLSLARSKVVMEYLVSLGLPERRFRLGGYGGISPRTMDPNLAHENSRLEIVIYQPDQTSLFGG